MPGSCFVGNSARTWGSRSLLNGCKLTEGEINTAPGFRQFSKMYETVLLVKSNYSSVLTVCCLKIEVIVFCLKFQADLACYGWRGRGMKMITAVVWSLRHYADFMSWMFWRQAKLKQLRACLNGNNLHFLHMPLCYGKFVQLRIPQELNSPEIIRQFSQVIWLEEQMHVKNYLMFRSIFCFKNCLDMRYTCTFMGELLTT